MFIFSIPYYLELKVFENGVAVSGDTNNFVIEGVAVSGDTNNFVIEQDNSE